MPGADMFREGFSPGRRAFAARIAAFAAVPAVSVPSGMALAQDDNATPPFVTTPPEVVTHMLRLAGTTREDLVIDLGSGDGRIVIAAAREFGARGIGIELDPKLVKESVANASAAGVSERARFVHGDVLREDIAAASVVTIYLLPWLMEKLQPRLLSELRPGTRIVSHAFAMPGWKPDRIDAVKIAARQQFHGDSTRVLFWVVPANARGEWRGIAPAVGGDWRVSISQNYQEVEVEVIVGARALPVRRAQLTGDRIEVQADDVRFGGRVDGRTISGEVQTSGSKTPLVLTRVR